MNILAHLKSRIVDCRNLIEIYIDCKDCYYSNGTTICNLNLKTHHYKSRMYTFFKGRK